MEQNSIHPSYQQ